MPSIFPGPIGATWTTKGRSSPTSTPCERSLVVSIALSIPLWYVFFHSSFWMEVFSDPALYVCTKTYTMEITATIEWKKGAREDFLDNRYQRMHTWHFDGGAKIRVSPSPSIVPLPLSDATLMDPEEAFLAAISSCHMLFFLSLAAKKKYVVQGYRDTPMGKMGVIEGKKGIPLIELSPQITFGGDHLPSTADIEALHHEAHSLCFLANSVKTDIIIH